MGPIVKFVVGIAGTSLLATAAYKLTRAPLLSGLGTRTAEVMIANGITDGRARWVTSTGWTYRVARLSGTADAPTRARTGAAVAALTGVHDALWEDDPATAEPLAGATAGTPSGDCNELLDATVAAAAVNFESNNAAVDAVAKRALDAVAQALQHCPGASVSVTGHTALAGAAAINVALSQARADAIVAELVMRGIAPERLVAVGKGSSMPLSSDAGPEADRRNSRVEFEFSTAAAGVRNKAAFKAGGPQ